MEEFYSQNLWWLLPLMIWSLVWKGLALWHASQKQDKTWFIVLLLVNTMGILEIMYIYIFSKDKPAKTKE